MDLRRWNVKRVREAIAASPTRFEPFPKAGAAGIGAIRERLGEPVVTRLLGWAEADLDAPIPALPAELYLEFSRTGVREGYEDAQRARRSMLYRLVLAEWIEGQGRFAAAIENLSWARLEETNWAWPAHARVLDFPERPTVDLAAAMTALDMAEIHHLVGDGLSPQLRARLRWEVDRRTLRPFLERHDHWWLHSTDAKQVNNWTAVCVAGVVGAALYLEPDPDRLAEVIARGLASLADYLETFDSDGGSSEGPDYWSYGFGNFAVFAHLLAARTGGAIDLFEIAAVRDIARFPVRTVMAPGIWASFSDSDSTPSFHPGLLSLLAERLGTNELTTLGMENDFEVSVHNQFIWPLRQYAWPLPPVDTVFGGTAHDWYPEMGWMFSRVDPADLGTFSLAIKGGHNDEMHNQNDVGSFIVVHGGAVVLTDPGRGRYSADYFGPRRYENIMASSRGHSVPVVNGHEQAEGREHAAELLLHEHGTDRDRFVIDMTRAYPADARLERLERSVTFERSGKAAIRLEDRFALAGPGQFESVLVTSLPTQISQGVVTIGRAGSGLRVQHDPALVSVETEHHPGVQKQYAPPVDLTRLRFIVHPERDSGAVILEILPI